MNISLTNSFVTAAITLIGGVILFILQHIIIEVFIRPIQKQKKTIEDIAISLINYSNLYNNPTQYGSLPSDSPIREKYMEASNRIRKLGALLKVRSDNILLYNVWVKAKYILPRQSINEAVSNLIRLSNSFGTENKVLENYKIADQIRISLNISS